MRRPHCHRIARERTQYVAKHQLRAGIIRGRPAIERTPRGIWIWIQGGVMRGAGGLDSGAHGEVLIDRMRVAIPSVRAGADTGQDRPVNVGGARYACVAPWREYVTAAT